MVVVSITKHDKSTSKKRTRETQCDASIPLSFIKRISSGTIKKLAINAGIVTLEELYLMRDEKIRDHVRNRNMLREIFDLKQQIQKMVKLAKHRNILLFEEKAKNKNIKIHADQRAQLIGIAIFANLCKDVTEVLSSVLDTEEVPFRQKAILKNIKTISTKVILKEVS